ncbi:MAG: hypothetical protein WD768_05360 [Phycisphaeraceae bacterium]
MAPELRGEHTVLVANRDEFLREIVVTTLESVGYRVASVPDVAQLGGHIPDEGPVNCTAIIEVDRDESATDLIARVRAKVPRMAVVLLTPQGLEPGFDGTERVELLSKPFQMNDLVKMVDRASGLERTGVLS